MRCVLGGAIAFTKSDIHRLICWIFILCLHVAPLGHALSDQICSALEAEESMEVLPWSSLPEAQAEQLKRQVLMLSHEKWNFLSPLNRESPPSFEPCMVGQAKALLAVDPQLNTMRFALVPTKCVAIPVQSLNSSL